MVCINKILCSICGKNLGTDVEEINDLPVCGSCFVEYWDTRETEECYEFGCSSGEDEE